MIVTSGAASVRRDAERPAREPFAVTAIDAHAHVFERGLPLAAQRRYVPDYDAPLPAYFAQLDGCGVSHGVLVQPSFLGTDCSYLLAALRREPRRLRGVAVIEPDCGFGTLAAMAEAGVVGIRLNLIACRTRHSQVTLRRAHSRTFANWAGMSRCTRRPRASRGSLRRYWSAAWRWWSIILVDRNLNSA